MELSGIELRHLINEISSRINREYYVSNIFAVTRDSFLFRMRHSVDTEISLMISVKGIWISRFKLKQVEESDLVTVLKNELERAKIESIKQSGSERIITIRFRQFHGESRAIMAEFFGTGNIILCDEKMYILAVLNPIQVRHRTLKVGHRYIPPPARGVDVFDITPEQLESLRSTVDAKDLDVSRWLGRNISLPKRFVDEIISRAAISEKKVGELSHYDISRIHAIAKELVVDVITGRNHEPRIILDHDGKAIDVIPLLVRNSNLVQGSGEFRAADSFMEAVDEVLTNEIIELHRNLQTTELQKRIAGLQHDLAEQKKAKEHVISKATLLRKIARELMDLSHESGNNILDDNSLKEIFAAYSAFVVVEKGRKYLEALGLRVPISNSSSAKMASLLFDKAKELENGGRSIESAEAGLLTQLNSLKAHTSTIRNKINIKENITKQWYERYRWFFTSQGLLAIGGNDATSNSAIIRKHLADNDIVFHAEVHGSPFFVLKDAKSISEKSDSLTEVAQATVSFSRGWKDELSSADAYWVEPSQVKRGAPTGQFLPRGSFVIQGRRNYIKGMEIKLAVGLVRSSGSYIVVCGPLAAVQRQSVIYVQLFPGGVDPNNVAKKIKTELVKAASTSDHSEEFTNRNLVEFVKSLGIGTFLGVIPSGHSKVSLAAKGAAAKSFSHDINR